MLLRGITSTWPGDTQNDEQSVIGTEGFAGWNTELGQQILQGKMSLESLSAQAQQNEINPQHQSGQQERLENLVNRYLFG